MILKTCIIAILALVLAPLAGGFIAGVDRRLTAWLQSRYGPPILQPFYDVFKLFGKTPMHFQGVPKKKKKEEAAS